MGLTMQIKKGNCRYRAQYHNPIGNAFYAAKAIDGGTEIAIARRILIAVAAQTFARNKDIIDFALRVQFVTDMATTTFTLVLINKV